MVRFRVGLGLGLGFNVDIQNGTIMSINEEPSPKLIGRQVDNLDLSTCRPSAIVNNKDPVRVRVRVSVWLGLGLG